MRENKSVGLFEMDEILGGKVAGPKKKSPLEEGETQGGGGLL